MAGICNNLLFNSAGWLADFCVSDEMIVILIYKFHFDKPVSIVEDFRLIEAGA
jgi:TM2 domain-containing membrane protein YozV